MSENSKIEWCDHTFNPWIGCTKVSEGCKHCYAESMSNRYGWAKWGKGAPRKRTSEANWNKPKQWNRQAAKRGIRYRVFCASLADWLDPEVPVSWRSDLLQLISDTPHLDWLMLTKRIEYFKIALQEATGWDGSNIKCPDNVWLGTTAENQTNWLKRVPILMAYDCKVHFVSVEPMLGKIRMGSFRPEWVICGGESGAGARPMDTLWASYLQSQCHLLSPRTAFFFKQWGGTNKKKTGRLLHGRHYNEFPVMDGDKLQQQ